MCLNDMQVTKGKSRTQRNETFSFSLKIYTRTFECPLAGLSKCDQIISTLGIRVIQNKPEQAIEIHSKPKKENVN